MCRHAIIVYTNYLYQFIYLLPTVHCMKMPTLRPDLVNLQLNLHGCFKRVFLGSYTNKFQASSNMFCVWRAENGRINSLFPYMLFCQITQQEGRSLVCRSLNHNLKQTWPHRASDYCLTRMELRSDIRRVLMANY